MLSRQLDGVLVSIRIRPEGRMRQGFDEAMSAGSKFQSSSDPKAGCDAQRHRFLPVLIVSILIRPEGRMRPPRARSFGSPRGFNPHPTRRPDATFSSGEDWSSSPGFQSSSDPKAGCDLVITEATAVTSMFQSSSDPKAGCDWLPSTAMRQTKRFNPHPTRRPDATRSRLPKSRGRGEFQSSSDPKAGCDDVGDAVYRDLSAFQSSSDPKAGCDTMSGFSPSGNEMFQSSSDPKAGCDHGAVAPRGRLAVQFQSSSDPKAGCDTASDFSADASDLVSILIRPEGRMRPPARAACESCPHGNSFNPHPTRRPDATVGGTVELFGIDVSILIRPEGRMRPGASGWPAWERYIKFQSSSDPKAGCDPARRPWSGR